MIQRIVAAGLGLLALAAPITAGFTLRETPAVVPAYQGGGEPAMSNVIDRRAETAGTATDRTPFRMPGQAPGVRFGAAPPPTIAPPPPIPRPHPVLTGILWGGTPVALLEGVPGHEAAVVLSQGDTAGGLRVVRVTRAA
ncbi:MAG: hypothetical protein SGJ01_09865 [Gemmatimonadota bacterium]|nr:hypothetical protein [Gemmatimonadota bacterium]